MFPFLEKKKRTKELDQNGLYIGAIHNENGLKRFLICLLRGLMVFLACYAVTVGVVEAFGLVYNKSLVTLALLAISVFASLLYINKPVFYVGYFFLLFGFTYALGYAYYYANSGFQAIINTVYEEYSDYFKLLSLRESQEFITDRYVTVTIAMIFIGALLAILLNVTISGYMNLLETILITFPFLEIAFYIDKRPPLYCLVMLVACYLCVGIQQAGKHFKMQVKGKKTPEYLRFRRKKETTYVYQSTALGTLQTLLFSFILSALIGFGFYTSYYSEVPIQPTNVIKEKTDNYVKIFVQSGFTGLLDRYDSTGGLNNGRLGGVSEIRPDFETDLTVTFAPYSYDTVYLKGFTGSHYAGNQWMEHTYLSTYSGELTDLPEEILASSNISISENAVYMNRETIASYDAQYMPVTASSGKMEIVHLDTGIQRFLPYYSASDDCVMNYGPDSSLYLTDGTPLNTNGSLSVTGIEPSVAQPAVTVSYAPYLGDWDEDVEPFDLPEYYDLYVHEFCLQIPDNLKPVLQEYCAEQEFPGIISGEFTDASSNPDDVNAYRLAVAQAIFEHYVADFDYTMSPGTTPYRQDFVEYFLTTQKRGVCAHFASSATLLLRSMGVPARYVEGYCIPLSVMSNGQAVNVPYSEWYQGPTQVTENGVMTVNVTDAQAHAWVEIYLEGYGFVPFEMTPPDFAEENNLNFDFGDLFDGFFFMNIPTENTITNTEYPENYDRSDLSLFDFSISTSFTPVLIMLGGLTLLIILYFIGKFFVERYRHHKLLKEEKYAELIYRDYIVLCSKLKTMKPFDNPNPLPDELCKHLTDALAPLTLTSEQSNDINTMFILFEKALYAPERMTFEEYQQFQSQLANVYQLLKAAAKENKKLRKNK